MKKMAKPYHAVLILGLVFVLILAGCSGGSGGSQGSGSSGGSDGSGGSGGSDNVQTINLRIGSGHTVEGGVWTQKAHEFFVPEVNKRLEGTGYQIKWTEAYGGSVAKLGENLDAVQQGLLDLSVVIVPFKPSDLLISNIGYNTPFGTTDPEIMAEVLVELYNKYPEFGEEFKKKGQRLLAFGTSDSYEIVTKFPINTVEDLKGHKIGGAGSNLGWIEPIGVTPVQAGLSETYQSIQTGVFEGYIMYTRGTLGYRLHEVAPYFTEVGFGSILVAVLTINENTYNNLPPEVQKVIDEVGAELTFEIARASKADREANLQKMIEEGAIHSVLSEEERAKWAEMLPNQPNEYAKKLNEAGLPGSQIVRDYLQLIKEKAGSLPREYVIE
ncbi:MAG: hypothetical protein BAA02_12505 [Paenibacillaceae bacterium ZCTH02-B3]|nr:MAG: hypothetical protein BAA02_12505 [Paenibacillaceae bacterium ZCTH02-B3]